MIRFDDFLQSGEFGPIRFDASQEDIRGILGPPDDIGNPEAIHWPTELWFYGGSFLQVFFETKQVIGVGLYFRYPTQLPQALDMDHIPFSKESNRAEIGLYLSERKIHHRLGGWSGESIIIADATEIVLDVDGDRLDRILAFR